MEHELIVANRSVERYVLDEMEAPERDAFEEHYFECAECGDEVRSASAFIANARAVLSEREVPATVAAAAPARSAWMNWLLRPAWSAALAGGLLLFTGYQNVVRIPALQNQIASVSNRQIVPFALLPETRGEAPVLEYRPGDPLVVAFEVNAAAGQTYSAELTRADSGSVIAQTRVSATPDGTPIQVSFGGAKLQAGQYVIVLRTMNGSGSGEIVSRYPFEVKLK